MSARPRSRGNAYRTGQKISVLLAGISDLHVNLLGGVSWSTAIAKDDKLEERETDMQAYS